MNATASARIAWWGLAISIALTMASVVLILLNPARTSAPATIVTNLTYLAFPIVGALIMANRPGNRIGALLLAIGSLYALAAFSLEYSWYSVAAHDATLPWTVGLPLVTGSWWAVMLGVLTVFLPLLFPDGYVPSPRWRFVAWIGGIGIACVAIGSPFQPITGVDEVFAGFPPPGFADLPAAHAIAQLSVVGVLMWFPMIPFAMVALVQRFRRSRGVERERMKWFVFGVTIVAASVAIGLFLDAHGHEDARSNVLGIGIMAVPICTGIAILRTRLYDIDVVIKKALVALVLTLVIVGAGIAAFATVFQWALWGATPKWASILAGIAFGALLWPLLRLSRRIGNRITYGRRATPYEVLTEFSSRVGETFETQDLAARMAHVLGRATGATSARVILLVGGRPTEAARWGDGEGDDHVVPVIHQGEELGALAISLPANDPLDDAKERLATDLASQAGPVFRNLILIGELRSSRQRLVAAQDEERRKLERNIHDGAQQQLVALSVKQRLAASLVGRDDERVRSMLDELQSDTNTALEDLRDLARGIYPPLLADKGLGAALQSQARKAAIPVSVEADAIGRFPQGVEATVYFCTLEALNNVAKYAGATRATVRIGNGSGQLTFEVKDDGCGFDTAATGYGTGLQGMADRLAALGGELSVTSDPDGGTTIVGAIPVEVT